MELKSIYAHEFKATVNGNIENNEYEYKLTKTHGDMHNMCEDLEIIDIKFSGWDWPVSCNEQEDRAKMWFLSCIHVIHVT